MLIQNSSLSRLLTIGLAILCSTTLMLSEYTKADEALTVDVNNSKPAKIISIDSNMVLPNYRAIPALAAKGRPVPEGASQRVYEFANKACRVTVFEADIGVVGLNDYPKDEFWYLVKGDVSFTSSVGETQEFKAGDTLVLPKGYSGISVIKSAMRKVSVSCVSAEI